MGAFDTLTRWAQHHEELRRHLPTISPEELKRAMDAREAIAVVDLRHPLDFLPDPRLIPGAIRISPEELAARHHEIPRDREVIVYCTCPNESTSRDIGALLIARGITRVRSLQGGFKAWRARGYPLVEDHREAASGG